MFILKTEKDKIFWTLDGEHIFYVQTMPITKKGNDNIVAYGRNSVKQCR